MDWFPFFISLFYYFFLEFHASGTIFLHGDGHLGAILRQQVFYEFRPLQETEVAAIEVILVTHIVYLINLLDAVEIEVIDRVAIASS